jgi:hypothetical protein
MGAADFSRLEEKSDTLHATLHAQNQAALIEFLRTDTEIAQSLLETARITRYPDRKSALIETVQKAVVSILRLAERIEDPSERS